MSAHSKFEMLPARLDALASGAMVFQCDDPCPNAHIGCGRYVRAPYACCQCMAAKAKRRAQSTARPRPSPDPKGEPRVTRRRLRTAAENRINAEREARDMRAMLGTDATRRPRFYVKPSAEDVERSRYLDGRLLEAQAETLRAIKARLQNAETE